MKRWGLRNFRSHGDSGDCDTEAAEVQVPDIQDQLTVFCKKEIFNVEEFGLNYRMDPKRKIEQTAIQGRMKEKDTLSVLECKNEDGSEKRELMIIGRDVRPR